MKKAEITTHCRLRLGSACLGSNGPVLPRSAMDPCGVDTFWGRVRFQGAAWDT